MKPALMIGAVLILLGLASFFIDVPRRESHGIKVGDASLGVQVRHDERLPVWVGGLLIAGGVVVVAVGARGRA